MHLIYKDKRKRIIRGRGDVGFSSFSSFHLISITARARSEKQISDEATDDEELVVKIDGKIFPKLGSKEALLDSPVAFNGGQLHDLSKTVYFLTFLEGKEHTIILETDEPHNTATFEGLEIHALDLDKNLRLEVEKQAEDGDRRPWIAIALDALPSVSITFTTTYTRRKWDSDDVKVIIDGKTYRNILRTIKHIFWRFAGSLLPKILPTLTETETLAPNLPQGVHYIEFHADRMPVLHNLRIDFGRRPQPPIRIPTVDDPKWTGDFYDDSEEMLLARLVLGEASDQSVETKAWVAGAVLNRVKAEAWPNRIHEVILQPDQYDPFKPSDPNYPKIIDPLKNADERTINAWGESFEVSRGILSGRIKNPTEATHFHGRGVTKRWFLGNIVPDERWIKTIDDTYFYWSPN